MHQDDDQWDNADRHPHNGANTETTCAPRPEETACHCTARSAPLAPRALSWQCAARPWAGFLTRHLPG